MVKDEKLIVKLEVGADRLEISQAKLIGINYKHFKSLRHNLVEKSLEGVNVIDFDDENEITISELSVVVPGIGTSDNWVIQLDLQKQKGLKGAYYIKLSVNAPKIFDVTNEKNVSDSQKLKHLPLLIERKLAEVGVAISLDEAHIKSFEVNSNTTDPLFIETFELINEGWKAEGEKVFIVDSSEGYESLKLKRATRTVKLYDKVKELREKNQIAVNDVLTRVEVSTTHTTTIQRLLNGDTSFTNFCENIEALQKFYKKSVVDDIQKPARELAKRLEEMIYAELEQGKKPREVYDSFVNDKEKRSLIVDLKIFDNAMRKYYKKYKKPNVSRDIKNLHQRVIKTTSVENYEKLTNNLERIEQFVKQI